MTCFPYGGPPQRNSDDMGLPAMTHLPPHSKEKGFTPEDDQGEGMSEIPDELEREAWREAFVNGTAFIKTNADGSRERVDPQDVYVETVRTPGDVDLIAMGIVKAWIKNPFEDEADLAQAIAALIVAERNRCIRRVLNGLDFGWLQCSEESKDHLMRALRGEV